MTSLAEKTHRTAEVALGALKTIGLPASPQNYELWYAHIEGRNPSLSREIQLALDADEKISTQMAYELYKKHILNAGISRDVIDLVSRFREQVTDLYDVIEKTGASTTGHNQTLSGLSKELGDTTEQYPAVGTILESVLSVAKEMQEQNEQLESRLADSTSEINELQRNIESVQAEAFKDPLTGIANRAKFDEFLDEQMSETDNTEALTLIMADVDHFKAFNDKWGHTTGDQVLRLVAGVMKANVKGRDLLARYGGEEFAIVLPETSVENAQKLANRIRIDIESKRLKKRRTDEELGSITMSMGVASYCPNDTADEFIERSDKCLYAAKHAGRNRVFSEQDMPKDEAVNKDRASAA